MAKKITEESLRLNIIVNGDRARQQILEQEKSIGVLRDRQQKLLDMRQKLEQQDKAEIISDPLSRVKFFVAIILCFVRSHLVAHPRPKIVTPAK